MGLILTALEPTRGGILLAVSHLWSYVVWCSTECLRVFARSDAFLAHAKVSNFAMTICIKKYIVQFQISAAHSQHTVSETRMSAIQQFYESDTIVSGSFTSVMTSMTCFNFSHFIIMHHSQFNRSSVKPFHQSFPDLSPPAKVAR